MGDWDFLYEMNDRGYSAEEISDAAGCGIAPWDRLSSEWIDDRLDAEEDDDAKWVESADLFKSRGGYPLSVIEQARIFEDLIDCAVRHFENTGRYLQVWGELGEMYAEIKLGLRRHATHQAGSDGTIAGVLVEVKTISPEKSGDGIIVKRQGNFEKLLIVQIDREFRFRSKLFDRGELRGTAGKFLRARMKSSANTA